MTIKTDKLSEMNTILSFLLTIKLKISCCTIQIGGAVITQVGLVLINQAKIKLQIIHVFEMEYIIKAKSTDVYEYESDWNQLNVGMPKKQRYI